MIVLDTDVVSEMMKAKPEPAVLRWLNSQPAAELYATAVTEAEMLLGVALLPRGQRRRNLETAVRAAFADDFAGRILSFDSGAAAGEFATIAATRRRAGRPIGALDAMIAAIARSRGAAVATRDIAGFIDCGIELIDPWAI